MASSPHEELLGDDVTRVVRVGDTVRRPVRPFTATVQAYLAHLHRQGFTAAPLPLGVDEQGREVLSFVPGWVPREPLPAETAAEDVLAGLARLIRRLHDASAGWTPPADAVWGGLPGARPAREHAEDPAGRPAAGPAGVPPDGPSVVPADGARDSPPELVSHRDYCPGNVVFRDGLPAALIDFDLAKPTTRLYDIANALYWWAPLLHPADRAPAFVTADIPRRAAVFAGAYGMTEAQRSGLMPVAVEMVRRFHASSRAAAGVDPVFLRFWEEGGKDRMPRAEAWIERAAPAIAARLVAGL
jgi:hypothetical protein